jgi:hypothetical protein
MKLVLMNQNVLKIAVILISCLFLASFVAAASNTTQSKSTAKDSTSKDVSDALKPTVTVITPTSGKVGENVTFSLTGTGFSKNAKVYLENESNQDAKIINAKDLISNSTTALSGAFTIPTGTEAGSWTVFVKVDGQTSPSKVKFTISK